MTDVDASPGDPVFYLHHNYLDRLYWQWQQLNPNIRLDLIAGNTTIHEVCPCSFHFIDFPMKGKYVRMDANSS